MPGFLAAIGTSLLTSVGVTAAAITSGLAIAVGTTLVGFVTYTALRGSRLRDSGDGGASIGNQQILIRSTTEPRKIVYGEAVVSGPIVWQNTNSDAPTPNGSLYAVIALAGHEIESFEGFYLDDKFIPIADVDTAGDGAVDQDTNSHGFGPVGGTPVLYIRGHTGASSQTVDTMMDSGFTLWASNHRGRGVAYVVVRMDQVEVAEEVWQSGPPSNISALIRGKKVYDPRLDSTRAGGSGAHRLNDPTTWEWSDNPALCTADYHIDSSLGCGMESSRLDYDDLMDAADDCEASAAIPTSSTQARFTCNGVLSCGDTHRENIMKLLSSMAGTRRRYNGKVRIRPGVWGGSSDFALTESDLVGPITYQPGPDRSERYNSVRGLYFDPARQHKEIAYLPVEDTTLQSGRDGGMELWKELDLPMTNNEYTAQRIAIRMVEQAARTGVCVFPMGYQGLNIAPGDCGTVTIAELGWSAKTFRCIGVRHVDMVGVELVLKEDDAAAYIDPVEGDYGTRIGATVVSFPRFISDWPRMSDGLLSDPFFTRTTQMWDGSGASDGEYLKYFWYLVRATSGYVCSIEPTGGVIGGVLRVNTAVGAGDVLLYSIPRDYSSFITDEGVRLNLRIRKTNNVTSLTTATVTVYMVAQTKNPAIAVVWYSVVLSLGATDVNGWTVNQWQEYEIADTAGNAAASNPQFPYLGAEVRVAGFDVNTNLEIDCVHISRIT